VPLAQVVRQPSKQNDSCWLNQPPKQIKPSKRIKTIKAQEILGFFVKIESLGAPKNLLEMKSRASQRGFSN
jgi:hypothetical protein